MTMRGIGIFVLGCGGNGGLGGGLRLGLGIGSGFVKGIVGRGIGVVGRAGKGRGLMGNYRVGTESRKLRDQRRGILTLSHAKGSISVRLLNTSSSQPIQSSTFSLQLFTKISHNSHHS